MSRFATFVCPKDPTHFTQDFELDVPIPEGIVTEKRPVLCPVCSAPITELDENLKYALRLKQLTLEAAKAHYYQNKPLHVQVSLCHCCGFPDPRTWDDKVEDDHVSLYQDWEGNPHFCQTCKTFAHNHPEVFEWIMRTNYWRIHRAEIEEKFAKVIG